MTIVTGDVRKLETVETLASKTEVIFHLATRCLVQGLEDPRSMHGVNDLGTYNICLAAKKHGCKIVYFGTSEQYGNQTEFPIKETAPMNPVSIYGLTKLVAENYVSFFHNIYGVPAVIIRCFNTYGPRHREDSYAAVITEFMKRLKNGQPLIIQGDGQQTRELTYISDVVDGTILLSTLYNGEIINIGGGTEISILDLANLLSNVWHNKNAVIEFTKPRPHDIKRFCCDITKAKSYGYKPKVSLEEGLRRYVAYFKQRGSNASS